MRRVTLLLIAAFLCSFLLITPYCQVVRADPTTLVRVIPETIELGPEDVVGQIITVAVVIEDVENLNGIGWKFSWNTTYLTYDSYTMTMPVEMYNTVQPPSPYAGILHAPLLILAEVPDLSDGIYEFGACSLGPPFNGSGTVSVISFRVIDQPQAGEADVTLDWHFILIDLADSQANSISCQVRSGTVIIHAPEPPPSPPIGGTSVSIGFGKFSSWMTATFLLVAVVIILNVKWNRRSKKH